MLRQFHCIIIFGFATTTVVVHDYFTLKVLMKYKLSYVIIIINASKRCHNFLSLGFGMIANLDPTMTVKTM